MVLKFVAFLFIVIIQINVCQSKCTNIKNTTENCPQNKSCSFCYNNFGCEFTKYELKLMEFDFKVTNFSNDSQETQKNDQKLQDFVTKLKHLNQNTKNTTNEDVNILEKIKNVHGKQEEALEVLVQVLEFLEVTENNIFDTAKNIREPQCLIEDTKELFDNTIKLIQINGTNAFENARNRSDASEVHSEEMATLAQEAVKITAESEAKLKEFNKLNDDTKNITSHLDEMFSNVLNQQQLTNNKLNNLTIKLNNFEQELITLQQMSETSLNLSQNSENVVLKNLNVVENIKIPSINITKNKIDELRTILNETTSLLSVSNDLLDKTQEEMSATDDLLYEANKIQKKIDELLKKAQNYFTDAENATNSGTETLNNAKNLYARLSDFNEIVQKTKSNSTESLKEIPEIERRIKLINEKARDFQTDINEAQNNLNKASNIVTQAQNLLPENIETNFAPITKLNPQIEILTKSVLTQENKIQTLENELRNETQEIENAKLELVTAQNDVLNLTTSLDEARIELDEILKQLGDLERLDDDDTLDKIEEKLLKYGLKQLEIEIGVNKHKIQQEQHDFYYNLLFEQYETDLLRLTHEVELIDTILTELPDSCLKDYVLEP